MENRNEKLEEIKVAAQKMEKELNSLVDQKSALSYNLERYANLLFLASVLGSLIAVFSQVWIGMLSMALACLGCVLLIYRSRANLPDAIDVNTWLATRCMQIVKGCSDAQNSKDRFQTDLTGEQTAMGDYEAALKQIIEDRQDYLNRNSNPSLEDYYEKRHLRNKYSSKLKNKYNKHEIKQYI